MLFKPEEFENAGCAFSCGQKTFRKRNFSKTTRFRGLLRFQIFSVDGKHLMCFQGEASVFKLLRPSVDRALGVDFTFRDKLQ